MLDILSIIKYLIIIQLILIIIGMVLLFFIKIMFLFKRKLLFKKNNKVHHYLMMLNENPEKITKKIITFLQNSIDLLLTIILLEKKESTYLNNLLPILSEAVLKPKARKLCFKKNWRWRYFAAVAFYYGIDKQDEDLLIKLIFDSTLLVMLNAGIVIFKYPSQKTMRALIDAYAKGRYLQQSAFAEIVTSEEYDFRKIEFYLVENLKNLTNAYKKAFCYRILSKIPSSISLTLQAKSDLKIKNKELKIAILNYLALFGSGEVKDLVLPLLNDESWEVRAIACKTLSFMGDDSDVPLLEKKLYDTGSWVRKNAALTLSKLGMKGIKILQEIKAENKETYELAQMILKEKGLYG